MTQYQPQQDDQKENLIGIGDLPFVSKKEHITPHIRHNDLQLTKEQLKFNVISPSPKNNKNEGELAIDVYETPDYLYIIAPIAGVEEKNLKISITEDVLLIEGARNMGKVIPEDNYLIKECYWGNFSRSIILPLEADSTNIKASFEKGILKIKIAKIDPSKPRVIELKND